MAWDIIISWIESSKLSEWIGVIIGLPHNDMNIHQFEYSVLSLMRRASKASSKTQCIDNHWSSQSWLVSQAILHFMLRNLKILPTAHTVQNLTQEDLYMETAKQYLDFHSYFCPVCGGCESIWIVLPLFSTLFSQTLTPFLLPFTLIFLCPLPTPFPTPTSFTSIQPSPSLLIPFLLTGVVQVKAAKMASRF